MRLKGRVRNVKGDKWQLIVELGKTVNGKNRQRRYRTVTTKNKTMAENMLSDFIDELRGTGHIRVKNMNFVDFVNEVWLPKCGEKRLAHTTLTTFIHRLENHILPAFRYFNLDEIEPIHVIDFLDNMGEEGMRLDGRPGKLSSASIFFYYRILNNIFNFAVEIRYLKESPLEGVKKPKVEYKETEVYSTEEVKKLLSCLETETEYLHWQVMIKLAITTGMRRSELFGLEFKHIDLDEEKIYVEQALTYSKQKGIQVHEIKKGSRSAKKRVIALSDMLIEPLRRLRLLRKEQRFSLKEEDLWEGGKHDFLVCNKNGKPYNPTSLRSWWLGFIERHNLKYINVHALRHTSATLLINADVHPKVISGRLGHSDIKTTMNIYGHALEEADIIATQKMDDVLFKDN